MTSAAQNTLALRGARVLVVDDMETVRLALRRMLTRQGHYALMAEDGATALAELSPDVDLVYLDCELPGLDGIEVTRLIREHDDYRDLPIIMITSHRDRETRIRALQAGVTDFLSKPVDQVELKLRTDMQLELKRHRDALARQRTSLEAMVAQRSEAVHRALLEVERQRDELRQAHLDTLERLALAAEHKDRDTARHVHRVGAISALLARHRGCSAAEVELIRLAAPLHDVGKIGIPDAILLAPRRLTPEERETMQAHAEMGARILRGSSSDVLRAAEEIALTHHEWWNGSGYPRGLAGEEIPLFGRITAVADVFDALSSRRPYKRAYDNARTLEIMQESRGNQFEPTLLDLLVAHMDEVERIQREVRESFHTDGVPGATTHVRTPPQPFSAFWVDKR